MTRPCHLTDMSGAGSDQPVGDEGPLPVRDAGLLWSSVADTTAVDARPVLLLQALMRQRHLTREQTVEKLHRRARQLGIKDFALSVRQLDRWLAGDIATQPHPTARLVLEAEFGYPIKQLLSPVTDRNLLGSPPADLPDALLEVEEVARRCQQLGESNLGASTLESVDALIAEVGAAYEHSDAVRVYPVVLGQRRWVEDLLNGRQPLSRRVELYVLAGKLSALLGYLAFDRGHPAVSAAYCSEAFDLAREAGHHDLAAWVRGVQSFVAYYSGRHQEALDLARDGQRWAAGGPQSVRLAISGEARALGILGDRAGVDRAVAYALDQRDRFSEPDPVGEFLSFGPLGSARVLGNAASAYLPLGAHDQVEQYTRQAVEVFQERDAPASEALTLMDLAVAHLDPDGDPEVAHNALESAMEVGAGLSSEVVRRRASQVLSVARRRQDVPQIAAVTESLRSWQPLNQPPTR